MKTKLMFAALLTVVVIVCYSFVINSSADQVKPWPVPAEYEKMENPVEANSESLDIGKSLYNQHCKSCHGKEGLGDGPKAEQLDTPSGDFTSEEFHAQSDGALFYKSLIGRDDMPNYEKKIPDAEDMWSIVNYMRTFE